MDPSLTMLSVFMDTYNYTNLTRNNTCLKGLGSCISLILEDRKYCFKHTKSFENGLNDHQYLINSMLKMFQKEESKKIIYCHNKQFQWESSEKDFFKEFFL